MRPHSEEQFLELIDKYFPREHKNLTLGRGDDCAVIPGTKDICISSDLFLEDIHFRREYFSPEEIGYKALAVNISDIAGMGAKPVAFNMDLMIPDGLDGPFWEDFFKGMSQLAKQNDIALAGGDLSRAEKFGVSITIWGVAGGSGTFLTRGGCQPGDTLFTVGELGLAHAGLHTLEAVGPKAKEVMPTAVGAHLRPKPKVLVGTLLNAAGVRGLMDVSDGLARDLPRFLGPDLGADIEIGSESLHRDVVLFATTVGANPVDIAMVGGEDYALLGAASPDEMDKVTSVPGVKFIGTVTDTPGIKVNGNEFKNTGFDHFDK